MNIVTLTLWDKFQAEFLAKYHELEDHQPVIVILKHGKIKEPQGTIIHVIVSVFHFSL
jgi:tRNA(Phe) wybutosine-synthesizing methylase Tyw3